MLRVVTKPAALVCLCVVLSVRRRPNLAGGPERNLVKLIPRIKQDMLHRVSGAICPGGAQQQQWRLVAPWFWSPERVDLDEPNEVFQPNIVKQIGVDVILKLNLKRRSSP